MNLVKTKVMVREIGQVTVKPSSKKDPCGIRDRKTMISAVLCKSCGNWKHGRCARIKIVTNRLEIDPNCRKHKRVSRKRRRSEGNIAR